MKHMTQIDYIPSTRPDFFQRAAHYRRIMLPRPAHLHEQRTPYPTPCRERHLHCIWFDPHLRPDAIESSNGERIRVIHPGTWNLEKGPDFLDATLEVGPDRRILHGDAELHIHPADWKHHGHQTDPAYRKVRFHITLYPQEVDPTLFPPGCLQIPLRPALDKMPGFSFENIDITAYPYAWPEEAPPCQAVLATWQPDAISELLNAAGEERLQRKTAHFKQRLRSTLPATLLYTELMIALGYKNNKAAMHTLAQRLPLERLRNAADGDCITGYALLLAMAGLLPDSPGSNWPEPARHFLRILWDRWWKHKNAWAELVMAPEQWNLANSRPQNHPRRRLMAAAQLFCSKQPLLDTFLATLDAPNAATCILGWNQLITAPSNTWWDTHLSWTGSTHPPTALIGASRFAAISCNVLLPFAAAISSPETLNLAALINKLPVEALNQTSRQAAHMFFGRDHASSLYRSTLQRQGLLQLFRDFCLSNRSICESCPFPDLLRSWTPG